jgi:hypothetical protein
MNQRLLIYPFIMSCILTSACSSNKLTGIQKPPPPEETITSNVEAPPTSPNLTTSDQSLDSEFLKLFDIKTDSILYSYSAVKTYFNKIRNLQAASADISYLNNRLIILSNSQKTMKDTDLEIYDLSSSNFVVWLLQLWWGVNIQSTDVTLFLTNSSLNKNFASPDLTSYPLKSAVPVGTKYAPDFTYRFCSTTGCLNKDTLFVFLPGTNSITNVFNRILTTMSDQGIPALSLMYNNSLSPNDICVLNNITSTIADQNNCFIKVRRDGVEGSSADIGIIQRLKNALLRLGWHQYFRPDGSINTDKIIFGGHSQGAGMVAWIGKNYSTKRICQFAGTWDFTIDYSSGNIKAPASWLSSPSKTPSTHFYGFTHKNDILGVNNLNLLWSALGMGNYTPLDITNSSTILSGQKIFSADPSGNCLTNPHTCTAKDSDTPINPTTMKPVFERAWLYTCLGIE